jgi:sigma-B regulation protein RsbQ
VSNIIKRNNVKVIGNGEKTLMFAHGFGCDQNMWERLTPYFKDDYRLVLFDYVGSGQSELSAFDRQRYSSINGYAQDIIDVCEALYINEAVFIGHSVSCSAGIVAANLHPEYFSQLVLIGPSPCFLNLPPDYLGGFDKQDLEELLELMDQNFVGWANYLAPVVAGLSGEGQIAGELSASFCSTDPLVAKTFARTTFFADNRKDFEQNNIPCLLLQHEKDTLAPLNVGEYLNSNTAKSTYRVLDVVGHCAHMSHAELVSETIKKYLSGHN